MNFLTHIPVIFQSIRQSQRGCDKTQKCFVTAPFPFYKKDGGYRTFCVDFNTDEVRHCLASSVFYPFPKKIKGGQNELVKNQKIIALTALLRVISF